MVKAHNGFAVNKRISSFSEARRFHLWNTVIILFYVFIIIVLYTLQVIIDRTAGLDVVKVGKANFGTFTKIS